MITFFARNRQIAFIMACWGLTAACITPTSGDESELKKPAEAVDGFAVMQGKIIAQVSANALSSELNSALQQGGVSGSINHCNLEALPLMDSLSSLYHATIKRTSIKVRNQKNAPTVSEREVLKQLEGNPTQGSITRMEQDGKLHFYAPIFIQSFCLSCHGKVETDISKGDHSLIKALYPNDEAIGYTTGELRGMWSIAFDQKKE
jgi:hypothetical protein